MSYRTRLLAREAELGHPIRVGLVGTGQMGTGFVAQLRRIAGMEVVVAADVVPGRAAEAFRLAGVEDVVADGDTDLLATAIAEGRRVATTSAEQLTQLPVDIVVEASGVPEVGARVAFAALLAGKDVALLNVETDVTVGWLLAELARAAGRVYTICRGDEPVEAKLLADFARDLAFEVVCAGKGKNNPLDVRATPDSLAAEAAGKSMNPKMLTSFVDGSKAMIEMAALANGTGLQVSRRGMHGVATTVAELAEVFRPVADGGVLDRAGVVDYATGPVAPGVFVVARTDDKTVLDEMDYLKMGSGPYYAFYRPYHLASIEAPLSIAAATLDRRPDLAPECWNAEVLAAAKRPLRAGEPLDGIGGRTVYGVIEDAAVARRDGLLPLGLVGGATLVRDVPEGTPLGYADVELDRSSTIVALRGLQDRLQAGQLSVGDIGKVGG